MSKTYNNTVILEKLNTIQIQTAVNPTQEQMVTGSDLKFNYKNIAGVNHLDDPAVKSFEEEEDKKREVKHMQLYDSFSTESTQTCWSVGSSGNRTLCNLYTYTALCFPKDPETSEESHYSIKSILSSKWASKRKVQKEIRKIQINLEEIILKEIRIEFQKIQSWSSSSFNGNRKIITCKKEALC